MLLLVAPSGVRVPFAVWGFGGCAARCVPSGPRPRLFVLLILG
jgi:hypothetical protein